MRAPQITLLFLIHICIIVYIEHLLIWKFTTELVNSISTHCDLEKITSLYGELVKPHDIKVRCDPQNNKFVW